MGRLQEQRRKNHEAFDELVASGLKGIKQEINPGLLQGAIERVGDAWDNTKEVVADAADGMVHSHYFRDELKEPNRVTEVLVEEVPKLSPRRLFGKLGKVKVETTLAVPTRVSPVDAITAYRSRTQTALLHEFDRGDNRLRSRFKERGDIVDFCSYHDLEELDTISKEMGWKN